MHHEKKIIQINFALALIAGLIAACAELFVIVCATVQCPFSISVSLRRIAPTDEIDRNVFGLDVSEGATVCQWSH